jgi:SNF family Na+-dependent transporter
LNLRDTFIITLSNAATSVFAGFVVFSYIGHLSFITHQEIKDVVSSGSGLAFIVFPFAVSQLPGAPFWSFIFFVMMLTLGLDSEFANVETLITSILDIFPKLKRYKSIVVVILIVVLFLLGLPYCSKVIFSFMIFLRVYLYFLLIVFERQANIGSILWYLIEFC